MSIDRIHCYVVTCDDCRLTFDETGSGYPIYFNNPDEAIGYLTEHGWTLNETGRTSCPRCCAEQLCRSLGHLWSHWHPCTCGGLVPHHATRGCPLLRRCDQCDLIQESDLAHLPTTAEPTTPGC